MGCDVSREQLWSWVDRDAPELDEHLAACPDCRRRTEAIRRKIRVIAAGSSVVVPEKVGPYTVKRLLGEGGQALVYEAEQPEPRRSVALKVLKGGRFAGDKLAKNFRRESQALARLQHPGIATIYEAGRTDEGLHYFAMEKVGGLPLDQYVEKRNPTREARLDLFGAICAAVEYAHERGVIHRDLKPSNIIVEAEGKPKVLDFGLAKMIRDEPGLTRTGTRTGLVAGTPRYMSPEQARGRSREIDARSDVYSLGVILYELLVGQPPHEIDGFTPEALKSLYEDAPARPSTFDQSIGGELDTVVLKALEKDPERRYRSVADLADDIRRFRDSRPILARPPSRTYRLRKSLYRHRRRVGLVLAALTMGLLVAWVAPWQVGRRTYDTENARIQLQRIRRDLLRDGPGEAVFAKATEAPGRYPGIPEAVLIKAQTMCLLRAQNNAVQLLETALRDDPGQWPYRLLLAEIKGRQVGAGFGDRDASGARASRLDSAESWYLRSFATLDVRQAIAWAEEAVERDAGYRPALATLALLKPIVGDTEGALRWATRLVDLGPAPLGWFQYKVELLFGTSRFDEALAECDGIVARYPAQRTPYLLRARTLRRLKRYEDAVRDFTQAIEYGGRDAAMSAWVYYHRGTLNWMLGHDDDAISDYTRAYRSLTYPTYANARLYFILHEQGRRDEAREALADARRRVWEDPWLATILSCLAGELTPAELVSSASDPAQLCEGYYYAGEVCLLQGRTNEAVAWFQACVDTGLEADPSNPWDPMSEYELAEWRLSRLRE